MIDVVAKVFLSCSSIDSSRTSAFDLIKGAAGLGADALMNCTAYVAHLSSVGASRRLLL